MTKQVRNSFSRLEKALISLKTIIDKPVDKDRAYIDASIQRFEFTVELFWKCLKRLIEEKGKEVNYPKDVLQEAYAGRLIDNESTWLKMLHDRNRTSHTYDEALADEIYGHIKSDYYPIMQKTFDLLYAKYR